MEENRLCLFREKKSHDTWASLGEKTIGSDETLEPLVLILVQEGRKRVDGRNWKFLEGWPEVVVHEALIKD